MGDSTPICRCRVLYLGSAVPRQSKDGLQGIQEPLRSLYPSEGAVGAKGIDSWLSVWSNGILLENVDENLKQITRFFPIESLHYCAAVRQVLISERSSNNSGPKFLPLDSPFARMPRAQHPPIFAAILRRTTGIKVLECHVFICKREAAANALVRCCFHAYADNSYARQLETSSTGGGTGSGSFYGTLKSGMGPSASQESGWRSHTGSTNTLNSLSHQLNGREHLNGANGSNAVNNENEGYISVKNFYGSNGDLNLNLEDSESSIPNDDENHKVWNGSQDRIDDISVENPYEVFSGNASTLGRPMRARQISVPVDVPPPPLKEENKRKKEKSSKSSGSQSLSNTLIRPKPIHPGTSQRSGMYTGAAASVIYSPVTALPPPHSTRHYHTMSHRRFPTLTTGNTSYYNQNNISTAPQPQLVHYPPHMKMPVQLMMPQHSATLQTARYTNKKKKDRSNHGVPVGVPIPPPFYPYTQDDAYGSVVNQIPIGEPRPLATFNRKLASSVGNGLDDPLNNRAESPNGTGIYRRKGHLNERAFSYSIRQEHRSRSHGSLASLQFNIPDMKKEREIAQIIAGLDLNDGEDQPVPHQNIQQVTLSNGGLQVHNYPQATYGNNSIYGNSKVPSNFEHPRR